MTDLEYQFDLNRRKLSLLLARWASERQAWQDTIDVLTSGPLSRPETRVVKAP